MLIHKRIDCILLYNKMCATEQNTEIGLIVFKIATRKHIRYIHMQFIYTYIYGRNPFYMQRKHVTAPNASST